MLIEKSGKNIRMNVLIISQYFWPENFRINAIALDLQDRGHNVTVLTGKPNYPEGCFYKGYNFLKKRVEKYKGIKIFRVPLIPRGKGNGFRLFLNYLSFAFFGSLLGPLFCREKYDIIFVFEVSPITVGFPAIVMKTIKRAPIFFWVLDLWPESLVSSGNIKSKKILNLVSKIVKFIYSNSDVILVSSKGFISNIKENFQIFKPIVYFPNFIEKTDENNKSIEKYKFPDGFNIVFAGNIGESQSFPTILNAVEKLKDYRIFWNILGDGRMFGYVKKEVKLRGLEKTFFLLGRYPNDSMPFFFSKADVLLVSLKREPNFELTVPGKIQSYLASGKPVIASLDGEGANIINEAKAGVTCDAEDVESLVEAVKKIFGLEKEERELLGENGKKYCFDNFNRFRLISKLEKMMEDFIKNH